RELARIVVQALDYDFQDTLRSRLLAQYAVTVQLLEAVPCTRIELALQEAGRGALQEVEMHHGVLDFFGRHSQPYRRHVRARGSTELDRHTLARTRAGLGWLAVPGHLDCLLDGLARFQGVRPGPSQRPHVGLERGIGTVAMVLHLPRIAFEADHGFDARHDRMG